MLVLRTVSRSHFAVEAEDRRFHIDVYIHISFSCHTNNVRPTVQIFENCLCAGIHCQGKSFEAKINFIYVCECI